MSTRLPPHVEFILEERENTLSLTSSILLLAYMPQTCVFLPNAAISGATS